MKALVADNDGETCALLREVLEDEGYQVLTAPDGRVALAHLWMTVEPLVVLLDQRMPGLTGTEVMEAYLHVGRPTVPREFILLMASPEGLNGHDGRAPVVGKPFQLDMLLETVARAAVRLEGR